MRSNTPGKLLTRIIYSFSLLFGTLRLLLQLFRQKP